MTFDQLNAKLGGAEKPDNWLQHSNGGGWVNKKAKIDPTVYIGENAIVFSGILYGNARVYGNAQVSGNAWVYGNARVSGNARVYGDAQVYGNAWVSGNAQVYGNAQVSGNARVYGDAWEKSPLFILGTKHSIFEPKKGFIQIGCNCQTPEWWLSSEGEEFARDNGYSDADIAEYRLYVHLFIAKNALGNG